LIPALAPKRVIGSGIEILTGSGNALRGDHNVLLAFKSDRKLTEEFLN
jgi:hypothetical protein